MSDVELDALAAQVGDALRARGWMLATAESCTGGWAAEVVTSVAGSSGWFDRGFVTYSNAAKHAMLGVPQATLDAHGAVSEPTALAMAAGALDASDADIALAITGVAGPSGGTPAKPVGTVVFAWCVRGAAPEALTLRLEGDRRAVRRQSVIFALSGVIERARKQMKEIGV